jgi:hypothetical protein
LKSGGTTGAALGNTLGNPLPCFCGLVDAQHHAKQQGVTKVPLFFRQEVKGGEADRAGCNIVWDYFGGEKKSWFLTDGDLPESTQLKRLQGVEFAVNEKRLICEKFCDSGWFFSHEAVNLLGLSDKKVGAILRSLRESGLYGYQISQKTIQKRWVHRCWLIEKDGPVKRKKSILSQRWI